MTIPPYDPPRPAPLEYERPGTVRTGEAMSVLAVVAFAMAVAGGGLSLFTAGDLIMSSPPAWVRVLAVVVPLAGIVVAINALLRIAEYRQRGDPMGWTALFLNTLLFLANGCCASIRLFGGAGG
jgi:hypothetical protein